MLNLPTKKGPCKAHRYRAQGSEKVLVVPGHANAKSANVSVISAVISIPLAVVMLGTTGDVECRALSE
jgi:hypothetical protein